MRLTAQVLPEGAGANFVAGCCAGAVNGVILNPMAAIRYHCWGEVNPKFGAAAMRVWRKAGVKGFVKGTAPTVLRDMTFGGTFTGTRHTLRQTVLGKSREECGYCGFVIDVVSAGTATMLSGPMNYARCSPTHTLSDHLSR